MLDIRLRRAACAVLLTAVLGGASVALIFSAGAAADPPTTGTASDTPSTGVDPPLTPFASVPLSTPAGTIQAVIYDGANTTPTSGGSVG